MQFLAHPNTPRSILYVVNGIGFAELFGSDEHPAVPVHHYHRWVNTLPSLDRLPYGVSREQAMADRELFDRISGRSL